MPSSHTRGMLAACFIVAGREHGGGEREYELREQRRMERSEDAVPFSDDTWKYGDMLIKTLRTHSEG